MTETKPKRKLKLELRDPARPLAEPESRPLDPNHPAARIFSQVAALADEQQKPPSTTHQSPPTNQPPPTNHAVAPERDFARVANSIVRNAVPAGIFRGESKKLYDAIYHRTRGAIIPSRKIRATQADLMEWARVSHNTLKSHLKHLSRVGLLKVHYVRGDNTGAEYEVFLPEETPPTTHHPPPSYQPATSQNLAPPTSQNVVLGGGGQVLIESTTSSDSKTSYKTNTERSDDDAALAGLNSALKSVTKEITGRDLSASENDRWKELADVLIAELKIAAARTTVSSVPAFLAEHLRRRLWKIDKKQARAEGRELPDEAVGQAQTIDASKCTDCGGSGWWYPDGEAKGVTKCKHEKLTTES
jgi:hypothetical protein